MFMFMFLSLLCGAAPVDRIPDKTLQITNVILLSEEAAADPMPLYGKVRLKLRVNTITCGLHGAPKKWSQLADFLDQVGSDAVAHPNADFGQAFPGVNQQWAPGYEDCNIRASTVSGEVLLYVSQYRACFGSAGCNSDSDSASLSLKQLSKLSDGIRAYLTQ